MKKTSLLFCGLITLTLNACGTSTIVNETQPVKNSTTTTGSQSNLNEEAQQASDTVQIGDQVWMTKNINTLVFNNGDTILQARSNEDWVNAAKNKIPAWCYMDNDQSNGAENGRLYNYWAVIDTRGLAPEGWRIPTDDDFNKLLQEVGATNGNKLKSTSGWENGGNGTNSLGFNATPAGYRNATGLFNPKGRLTCWWTLTEKSSGSAFGYVLIAADNSFKKDEYYKRSGLSVRCLR